MKVRAECFQSRFTRRYLERAREVMPEGVKDRVDLDFREDSREASLKSLLTAAKLLSRGLAKGVAPLALAGEVALELVDRAQEEEWAKKLDRQAAERLPASEDPVASERAAELERRLQPWAHRPIQVQAVSGRETNGFAALGGRVYLTEDVVRSAAPEALTWLAGHEVGHTESRDSIKAYGYNTLAELLKEAGGRWMSFSAHIPFTENHDFHQRLNHEYAEIQRREEKAADARGVELCRAAGQDPAATMAAVEELFASSMMHEEGLILPVPQRLGDLRSQILGR